jgi:hypothetical protein
VILTCQVCGEPFSAKRSDAKTCSDACRAKRSRRTRDPGIGSPERRQRQLDGLERKWIAFWRRAVRPEIAVLWEQYPWRTPGQRELERELAEALEPWLVPAAWPPRVHEWSLPKRSCRSLCGRLALPATWEGDGYCALCLLRIRFPLAHPQFTLSHTSQFGLERKPPDYWRSLATCECGSQQWVRGGQCWACRKCDGTVVKGGRVFPLLSDQSQPPNEKGDDECAA